MRHYVREWREDRGLTQEQVAKAIGLEHKASIRKIEAEPEKDLSVNRVNKLAHILQIKPEDLYRHPKDVNNLASDSSQAQSAGSDSPDLGEQDMVDEFTAWLREASDVPPDLVPAARNALRTLKAAVGERRRQNPQARAKGK